MKQGKEKCEMGSLKKSNALRIVGDAKDHTVDQSASIETSKLQSDQGK
jgi:hypothetical protein